MSDYPVTLPVGHPVQVRAPGDFIFLRESAFPVEIVVDGNPLVLTPGGKRRIVRRDYDQPAFTDFTAENKGPVDQRVVFIVGDGDYDEVIISGEINVSSYTNTASKGVSKSLPMTIRRECGIESTDEVPYIEGAVLTSSTTDDTVAESAATAFYKGYFYCFLNSGRVYRISETTPVDGAEDLGQWDWPTLDFEIIHASIDRDGFVYLVEREIVGGELSVVKFDLFGRNNVGPDNYKLVELDNFGDQSVRLHCFGGRVYYSETGASPDYVSVDGDSHSDKRVELSGGISAWDYGAGRYIWEMGLSGGVLYQIKGSGVVTTGVEIDSTLFQTPIVGSFGESGTAFCSYNTGDSSVSIYRHGDFSTYGSLYIQPTGNPGRKKVIPLLVPGEVNVSEIEGGSLVRTDWVQRVVMGAGGPVELGDYLTGYKYDNGLVEAEFKSGTETFDLRGIIIPVELAIFDGSEVTIDILPEALGA